MENTKTEPMFCPNCKKRILSQSAQSELEWARAAAKRRGGYIWEGARKAYEEGVYCDANLTELLACGALQQHPDPTKGWVVVW